MVHGDGRDKRVGGRKIPTAIREGVLPASTAELI